MGCTYYAANATPPFLLLRPFTIASHSFSVAFSLHMTTPRVVAPWIFPILSDQNNTCERRGCKAVLRTKCTIKKVSRKDKIILDHYRRPGAWLRPRSPEASATVDFFLQSFPIHGHHGQFADVLALFSIGLVSTPRALRCLIYAAAATYLGLTGLD